MALTKKEKKEHLICRQIWNILEEELPNCYEQKVLLREMADVAQYLEYQKYTINRIREFEAEKDKGIKNALKNFC